MSDLTIIYSTAHKIPERFADRVFSSLIKATDKYPVIKIECAPEESSITNYYQDLLHAAKSLTTPYLAFAEDDTLYPDEHFNQRPSSLDTFAYNLTRWNLYTWSKPPFFSLRQRKILATLIAPRQAFIEVMEKRLRNPDESQMVEPGRREDEKSETFNTYNPIVVFTHPDAFGYMGGDKQASKIRALEIPYFGTASGIMELYKEN